MKSRLVISLPLAFISALLGTILFLSPLGDRAEFFAHDLWFNIRGSTKPPSDIVVVAMDELSYRNLNVPLNQAWPRSLHARLLQKLKEYGVKKVAFDILFLDASQDAKADLELEKAIKGIPTVLGTESTYQQIAGSGGNFSLEEVLEPYKPFLKAAESVGLVGLPERNGHIREFLTERSDRTKDIPTLSEAAAGISMSSAYNPDSNDLINYYGPPRSIPMLSYYQVLEEERPLPKNVLEGKTVFVGLVLRSDMGPAKRDSFLGPFFGPAIYGVEIHASAAANLIDTRWISRTSLWLESLIYFVVLFLASFLILNVSPIAGIGVMVCSLLGWMAISYIGFILKTFIPGIIGSGIVLPSVYTVSTIVAFLRAQKGEATLRKVFELYVSPDKVSQLSNKGEVKLGGQKIWATVVFTDIKDFTTIAEGLPPEKATEMLNDYFTRTMDVVFANKGTVLKFIGDSLFVIWGAPVPIDDHAAQAVKTAHLLQKEIEMFNKVSGYPPLTTRIGIHTGPMVIGNLGSKRRFDYTAIGDSVNLASRIEGLNKYFGTDILFTEATRKDAGLQTGVINVGSIRAKGKREAVTLFTSFEPPASDSVVATLQDALEAFRLQNWDSAKDFFSKASLQDERTKSIGAFYEVYMAKLKLGDVPDGWNGEIDFDKK